MNLSNIKAEIERYSRDLRILSIMANDPCFDLAYESNPELLIKLITEASSTFDLLKRAGFTENLRRYIKSFDPAEMSLRDLRGKAAYLGVLNYSRMSKIELRNTLDLLNHVKCKENLRTIGLCETVPPEIGIESK